MNNYYKAIQPLEMVVEQINHLKILETYNECEFSKHLVGELQTEVCEKVAKCANELIPLLGSLASELQIARQSRTYADAARSMLRTVFPSREIADFIISVFNDKEFRASQVDYKNREMIVALFEKYASNEEVCLKAIKVLDAISKA